MNSELTKDDIDAITAQNASEVREQSRAEIKTFLAGKKAIAEYNDLRTRCQDAQEACREAMVLAGERRTYWHKLVDMKHDKLQEIRRLGDLRRLRIRR